MFIYRSTNMMKRIFLICLMTMMVLMSSLAYANTTSVFTATDAPVVALRLSKSSSDDDSDDLKSQITLNSEKIHANKLSTDADIQELQGELRSVQNILKVFFVAILVSLCLNIALVYYIKRHRL